MNIVKICPTCKESIAAIPLVDILVTYQKNWTGEGIYEQGWHRNCYPPAPALLAACEMAELGFSPRHQTGGRETELINLALTAQESGKDTGTFILDELRGAIAAARGEAGG